MKPSIIISILAAISSPFAIYFKGYVFTRLWEWFILPKFALPAIAPLEGAGIILILGFATWQYRYRKTEEKTEEESFTESLTTCMAMWLLPLVTWGMGALIHEFI